MVTWSLWSQIELTSYDSSDLHITGEFDNRPGTGRFLGIFSCVVTYRTGDDRRLYMITCVYARPGTVRWRTVQAGVVRESQRLTRIFKCNDGYNYIKILHYQCISLRKQRRNQIVFKYSIKQGCVLTELFTLFRFSLQNVKGKLRLTLYYLQNPCPVFQYKREW